MIHLGANGSRERCIVGHTAIDMHREGGFTELTVVEHAPEGKAAGGYVAGEGKERISRVNRGTAVGSDISEGGGEDAVEGEVANLPCEAAAVVHIAKACDGRGHAERFAHEVGDEILQERTIDEEVAALDPPVGGVDIGQSVGRDIAKENPLSVVGEGEVSSME